MSINRRVVDTMFYFRFNEIRGMQGSSYFIYPDSPWLLCYVEAQKADEI
jgi:hypothetical protein